MVNKYTRIFGIIFFLAYAVSFWFPFPYAGFIIALSALATGICLIGRF